jgi:hypothetical protein
MDDCELNYITKLERTLIPIEKDEKMDDNP